jgi:hypothetical protein
VAEDGSEIGTDNANKSIDRQSRRRGKKAESFSRWFFKPKLSHKKIKIFFKEKLSPRPLAAEA